MEKKIKCWHFLQNNKRLRWGTKEICKPGKTYTCEGPVSLCINGLHGSRKILDALKYSPGSICCKVEIWGDIVKDGDKLAGRNRKILKMVNAEKILRKFARMCALDVIDKWDAPEVVVKYLKTGNEKLRDATRAAARDATRAATRAAASAAEWDAARDAAWDATRAAARAAEWAATRAAAWAATRAAARDAAWAATRDATRDATWDAARKKQEKRLVKMITEAMK